MNRQTTIDSAIAAVICSGIISLIIFAIPGFVMPLLTGDGVLDAVIFVVGEFLLWFILWYLILSMRRKIRRAFNPDTRKE